MTGLATAPNARTGPSTGARAEFAWNASAGAIDGTSTYASAVLHLECEWGSDGTGRCVAAIERAGLRSRVDLPQEVRVEVLRRASWTHLSLRAPDGHPLLQASFDRGRLAWCTSLVPVAAGLPGGAYDAPTGILELYPDAMAAGSGA